MVVEDKLHLRSSASWVQHPDMLLLPHNGRTFEVKLGEGLWLGQPGMLGVTAHGFVIWHLLYKHCPLPLNVKVLPA